MAFIELPCQIPPTFYVHVHEDQFFGASMAISGTD